MAAAKWENDREVCVKGERICPAFFRIAAAKSVTRPIVVAAVVKPIPATLR
jgi:hypothetical protein